MTDVDLEGGLQHQVYVIEGMAAALDSLRRRIVEERIDKIPLEVGIGNPPKVMSTRLSDSQIRADLACCSRNLCAYAQEIKELGDEYGRDDTRL